eukprot:UN13202
MSCSAARSKIMNQHQQNTEVNEYVTSHIDMINNRVWHVGSGAYIFDNGRFKGTILLLHKYSESQCVVVDDGSKVVGKVLFEWIKTVNTDRQTANTYFIIHLSVSSGISELRGDFSLAAIPNSPEDLEGRRIASESSMRNNFDYYTTTNGIDVFTRKTMETVLKELYEKQTKHNKKDNQN